MPRAPSGERKHVTFVLDFVNDPEEIRKAFEPYYTDARLETTADRNIVHDISASSTRPASSPTPRPTPAPPHG